MHYDIFVNRMADVALPEFSSGLFRAVARALIGGGGGIFIFPCYA